MSVTPSEIICKPLSPPNHMGGAETLPCLYSNNSIVASSGWSGIDSSTLVIAGEKQAEKILANLLTPYHRKAAETLHLNVKSLFRAAPSLGHIGFLTLTTPDNCKENSEFERRLNSLKTNFLAKSPYFIHWICVKERQKRGSWHAHLIVIISGDIRSGINFEELSNCVYKSANELLRAIWAELREVLPKYGFGRHELLPVKTNDEGMSRYVGKYISKHIVQRKEEDKGVRLVSCSIGWSKNTVKWAWNTDGSHLWRYCLRLFARHYGITSFEGIRERFGPRWAYHLAADIASFGWAD